MIENILEYQKVDEKLIAIDKEIAKSESKKLLNGLYINLKSAQTKIIEKNNEARTILEELDKLTAVYNKGISLVEKYNKQSLDGLTKEELLELENKVKKAVNDLNEIEKRLERLSAKSEQVLKDYDETKRNGVSIKKQIQEEKIEFENYVATKSNDKDVIKQQLAKLEKNIEPKVLARYKALRQDGIFPIVVPVHASRCSGCRMEISMNEMDKLKKDGVIECDKCHRIIYMPKEN